MNLTDYDVLSFDCYGTLIDWETGIAAVIGPWARRFNQSVTDEDVLVAYAEHEAAVERDAPALAYPDVLRTAFRRTGAALGYPVTDADADELGTSVPNWPAFADSADALRRLKERYKLIILSNVDRDSFRASNQRLHVEFDAILTAQDIGSYKPSPANFEELLTRVDAMGARGALLHVAQSLFHDHVPAKAAGIPTVWINRRHATRGWGATPEPGVAVTPDYEFPSMADFANAVDARTTHTPERFITPS